jgi:hypothetical protein
MGDRVDERPTGEVGGLPIRQQDIEDLLLVTAYALTRAEAGSVGAEAATRLRRAIAATALAEADG